MEHSQTSLRAFFFRQINNDFSTFCFYSSLAELKCIRSRNEEDRSYAQDLAKSQRYSLQLERQLRELLQSPQGSGQLLNRFFFIKRAAKLLSCDGGVLSVHLQSFLIPLNAIALCITSIFLSLFFLYFLLFWWGEFVTIKTFSLSFRPSCLIKEFKG